MADGLPLDTHQQRGERDGNIGEHEQREEGQIHHLEGLLYFTDGLGIYPTHPAPYKTAFIFTEPELEVQRDFPQWAMKLILTEDEIDLL